MERIDGIEKRKYLKFHTCTEEDFAEFYPVAKRSEKRLSELKKNDALICLDAQELQEYTIEVYGEDEHSDF